MTLFFCGHYQDTLRLIHLLIQNAIVNSFHLLETALLLSCCVKGAKYTDMMQDNEEI